IFAHAITTDAWRNSLDHYQEFVIIVALDLKIEEQQRISRRLTKINKIRFIRLIYNRVPSLTRAIFSYYFMSVMVDPVMVDENDDAVRNISRETEIYGFV
ncbi:hypothetical protein, partial [Lacticaseibacillus paracasei]|uniref:hypothetical protein n=1 Tax=Lacticaseibacillus paracasei TaxID=1597 RepID=UPI00195A3305